MKLLSIIAAIIIVSLLFFSIIKLFIHVFNHGFKGLCSAAKKSIHR